MSLCPHARAFQVGARLLGYTEKPAPRRFHVLPMAIDSFSLVGQVRKVASTRPHPLTVYVLGD